MTTKSMFSARMDQQSQELRRRREEWEHLVERRLNVLERCTEKLINQMERVASMLADLQLERANAKTSMREVPEVLPAKEERVCVDRDEAHRWSTGTARNGSS